MLPLSFCYKLLFIDAHDGRNKPQKMHHDHVLPPPPPLPHTHTLHCFLFFSDTSRSDNAVLFVYCCTLVYTYIRCFVPLLCPSMPCVRTRWSGQHTGDSPWPLCVGMVRTLPSPSASNGPKRSILLFALRSLSPWRLLTSHVSCTRYLSYVFVFLILFAPDFLF